MLTKNQVLDAISAMPEDQFNDIENIIEEMLLLEKVSKGLDEMKAGKVISDEELDKEIGQW